MYKGGWDLDDVDRASHGGSALRCGWRRACADDCRREQTDTNFQKRWQLQDCCKQEKQIGQVPLSFALWAVVACQPGHCCVHRGLHTGFSPIISAHSRSDCVLYAPVRLCICARRMCTHTCVLCLCIVYRVQFVFAVLPMPISPLCLSRCHRRRTVCAI